MVVAADMQPIQRHHATFEFKALFVEELGWILFREAPVGLAVDGQTYILRPPASRKTRLLSSALYTLQQGQLLPQSSDLLSLPCNRPVCSDGRCY